MNTFIDIHNHSLPGVDDGAHSMEESLEMLRMAAQEGIGAIILTPHQKPDRACVSAAGAEERVRRLQKRLEESGIPIRLYAGGEVLYSHDMTGFLEQGKASFLAGSSYVLTEFLPDEEWSYIQDGVYSLLSAGYRPVLAHAERYENAAKDLDRIETLRESGCLIQINSSSLTGFGRGRVGRAAHKIVKEQLADFVATDAHRASGGRRPQMADCAAWLKRRCGEEYAKRLLYQNAESILHHEDIR